jgi:hypothetical protein
MFYCEQCRQKKDWPPYDWMRDIAPKSRGSCEICGNNAVCYDIASSKLPSRSDQIQKAALVNTGRDVRLKLPDRGEDDEKMDKG